MTRNTRRFIWTIALFATFTVFELALPIQTKATSEQDIKFIARRNPIEARIATTQLPARNICDLVSCAPTYKAYRSTTLAVTAYSSTPDQTWGNPFITASGTHVHPGTFALNGVPFGTKIRIPDYFGDRIFTVEDRMHARYSSSRGDIWMETRAEALQWGVRHVRVEFVHQEE